jgi:uncharacterized protein YbcI
VADGSPDRTKVRDELRTEILRVHAEAYGTGATDTTIVIEDDLVVMVLDVELTQAERTLLDSGRQDAVKGMREEFQRAIAPTFNAIVERATGRRVVAFISAMSVEPVYSVELFRLAPSADAPSPDAISGDVPSADIPSGE